jgi:hypothetical protein
MEGWLNQLNHESRYWIIVCLCWMLLLAQRFIDLSSFIFTMP